MSQLRYPIGVQTFSKIIEEGYAYIDKTRFIKPLLSQGHYLFLSRPRRFGKSLFLSTLEAYFAGRRDLFRGLEVDRMDMDWTPRPVLHFDFNNGYYKDLSGLLAKLHDTLGEYEKIYNLPMGDKDAEEIPIRFSRVIRRIYETTGSQVVVLVDEYDKPLLAVENDEEVFGDYQRLLKSFYGNLKSLDSMIRFAFITGVARFSKVSIFSDLNNLDDISMEEAFADICGWTEEELLNTFTPGIEELAKTQEETFDDTLSELRNYYDGYLFTSKGTRLYNPYSVLRALKAKDVSAFWFSTGSPDFLVKRVMKQGIMPYNIDGQMCDKEELLSVGLDDRNPIPLMFQTGYLTIDKYDRELKLYTLRFPNKEVELGFYKDLLPLYAPDTEYSDSPFNFTKFKRDLFYGQPDDFMKRLASLFKDLPGEDHNESTYRAITYLLSVLSSTYTTAEHHGYKGRSDIEVITPNYIYLFEFKYNKSVEEAEKQIYSRDYIGRFEMEKREVFLIAANFSETKEERSLQYLIRKVEK